MSPQSGQGIRMKLKRILTVLFVLLLLGAGGAALGWMSITNSLPQIVTVKDYHPLLVSEVYARGGEKIGEFYRENRILVPYERMPKRLVQAFLAAEDDTFFEHGGINYMAMLRAFLINLKSGQKRQGASTITQQVARSLLLSSEKTYTRKIKEVFLAYKIEENLSKEEILYLYLNQIYFGQGAYGVGSAAETYFRKKVENLTLPEMAILAGLPKAPTDYSPASNPQKAKDRQRYVLQRMAEVGFITKEEAKTAVETPIQVYTDKEYKEVGPFFVETLRQLLVQQLGEKAVLDEGLRIYTSLDFKAQQEAQEKLREGLREVDKRQGYRGPLKNLATPEEREKFLLSVRDKLEADKAPYRIVTPEGNIKAKRPLAIYQKKDAQGKVVSNLPDYVNKDQIVEALVTKVDDGLGLTYVRFGESQGLIDIADMGWARKFDTSVNGRYAPRITKPSVALKPGDVILVKIAGERFVSDRLSKELSKKKGARPANVPNFDNYASVQLEQDPSAEGALLSFDEKTGDVIAMVGGYDFNRSKFNRTIQANRQTGSSFKTIVYASALDKGYTPATPIQDAPIVYDFKTEDAEGQEDIKTWKPHNHGQKFVGDILFRNALIKSLNIPTVKILENVSVPWVAEYAHRLGVFSPLNMDLSLGLGSSSLTLYEMTKVFANFGRLGKRIRPIVIHKILDKDGKEILNNVSLDKRFEKEMTPIERVLDEKRKAALAGAGDAGPATATDPSATPGEGQDNAQALDPSKRKTPNVFFNDPDQLISPQTAYVMTTLLSGVINEDGGTAARARALGRPAAGKTGSTNGYFDGWFVGFTPQIATGVWVGFDEEKSLGPGEVGGHTALPIWLEYMKAVHKDLPVASFPVPPGIVFANIDNQTGKLASASSTSVVNQAFIQGTEPKELSGSPSIKDETDFYKEDLAE